MVSSILPCEQIGTYKVCFFCVHTGELSLQIIKNVDDFYTPVSSIVEEKTGTNFSLLCELVSSKSDNKHFDDQISWARESPEVNFRNESDLEDLAQDQYKLLQG